MNLDKLKTEGMLLGEGSDSSVYLFRDQVVKDYNHLIRKMGVRDALKILERYHNDTIRLFTSTHSEEKHTKIGDTEFVAKPQIVHQGEICVDNKSIYSIGQRYIPGNNLDGNEILEDEMLGTQPQDRFRIYEWMKSYTMNYLSSFASKILMTRIMIVPCNVKPEINWNTNRITLNITDISDSLSDSYLF